VAVAVGIKMSAAELGPASVAQEVVKPGGRNIRLLPGDGVAARGPAAPGHRYRAADGAPDPGEISARHRRRLAPERTAPGSTR
jgi:hypothetical protein